MKKKKQPRSSTKNHTQTVTLSNLSSEPMKKNTATRSCFYFIIIIIYYKKNYKSLN